MIKYPSLRHVLLATSIAAAFCPLSASAQAVDYSFKFPTNSNPPFALHNTGKWSQAAQWTNGQLPGSADVLQVTLPQTYQYVDVNNQTITNTLNSALLNHDSGNDVISAISPDNKADLRLTGGTLTLQNSSILNAGLIVNGGQLAGNGNLIVNGAATLDSGTMSGAGATTFNGSSTVLSGGLRLEAGRVLENQGNLNFQNDSHSIYSNDNTGRFDNSGTVSKTGGTVISTIGAQFNNSGIVDVQTGVLRLSGGGTQSGSFGGPGVVEFFSSTNNLQSGVNFNNINVSGTLNSPSVDYSIAGTSTFYGARMSGAGTTTLKGPANDDYGLDLTGNRVLEVSKGNTFDFRLPSSNVSSSDNTGTFNNFGTVTKSSDSGASGINAIFNNSGAVEVTQGGVIQLSRGGTHSGSFGGEGVVEFNGGTHTLLEGVSLNNINLGGTLASSVDYSIQGASAFYGGRMTGAGKTTLNGPAIDIYGLDLAGGRVLELSKEKTFDFQNPSSNVSSSDNTGTFNNFGMVTKSSGSGASEISAMFNNSGSVDVTQGGVLRLSGGGTHSGSFGGDGVVEFTAGTHTLLAGVSFNNIALGAASLDAAIDYSIAGTATFYGGKLSGIGRTILNGPSSVVYSVSLDSGRVLENHNVLDFNGDYKVINGDGSIDNQGTVRKSAGTDSSSIFTHFSNSGTVDVQSGTLSFRGLAANFTNNGILHTDAGAVLLASSIENTSNGIISGTGTVALNGGTLTNAGQINPGNSPGTLTVDGNLVLTSTSNLNIEIAGLNDFDKLIVTGQAILGGSLNLYAVNGYKPSLGDSFDFLWFDSILGNFDRVNLFGFDSGISARWDFNAGSLQLSFGVSPSNNSQIPEPSTIWLLIGGWGAWMTSRRGLLKSINYR